MKRRWHLIATRTGFAMSRWDKMWMRSNRAWPDPVARGCDWLRRASIRVSRGRDATNLLRCRSHVLRFAPRELPLRPNADATRPDADAMASDVLAFASSAQGLGPDEVTNGVGEHAMGAGDLVHDMYVNVSACPFVRTTPSWKRLSSREPVDSFPSLRCAQSLPRAKRRGGRLFPSCPSFRSSDGESE
jgi:hypothetical protein